METVRSEGEVIEPLLPWLWENVLRLAFYLLIASLVSAVLFVIPDPAFEAGDVVFLTLALFAGGGLYCLPGAAIWLVILGACRRTYRSDAGRSSRSSPPL